MKVVCCKNCGAKYQLDDNDDVTTFECSSCAGDLEYIEDYSNEDNKSTPSFMESFKYSNSYIVQCEDCGLKYKIKSSDSILDYECDSCGGPLRYLDDEMNKELDKYLEERKEEIKNIRKQSEAEKSESDSSKQDEDRSLKSFTNKLGNFFSEEGMLIAANTEKEEQEELEEDSNQTARTTIPQSVLSKFGKEFAVPKTDDYNIMKSFIKDEFMKGMDQYYPKTDTAKDKSEDGFFSKFGIQEPDNGELEPVKTSLRDNSEEELDLPDLSSNNAIVVVGIAIFILSIIEILIMNSGVGIVTLFIGVVILVYGIYKTRDEIQTEERTRIIREHLLTLPNEYYVFYNVKTPTASSGINHLVVGPTGIYALLSQKYTPKLRLESENENLSMINASELDEDKIEEIPDSGNKRRFRYTTKQAKFSKDDKIKQKSLSLGEDLINFLNDNNIPNCFVEPLVGFINNEVVVINMPLTDEDLFIDELLNKIKTGTVKLDQVTIDKCAVLINKYSADCSAEI